MGTDNRLGSVAGLVKGLPKAIRQIATALRALRVASIAERRGAAKAKA